MIMPGSIIPASVMCDVLVGSDVMFSDGRDPSCVFGMLI